jgi:DNA-binding NarL/FixJ family response regulator
MGNHKSDDEKNQISEREMEVLMLIADGYTTPMIAEKLIITENTAHNHRVSIFRKLNVHNVAAMIKAAREKGLIP